MIVSDNIAAADIDLLKRELADFDNVHWVLVQFADIPVGAWAYCASDEQAFIQKIGETEYCFENPTKNFRGHGRAVEDVREQSISSLIVPEHVARGRWKLYAANEVKSGVYMRTFNERADKQYKEIRNG